MSKQSPTKTDVPVEVEEEGAEALDGYIGQLKAALNQHFSFVVREGSFYPLERSCLI